MKAAQYSEYGDPSVIKINEIEKPALTPTMMLIEVRAASLNPFDYKVRRGDLKDTMPLDLPITIGGDYSGVVIAVGDEVKEYKVGDELYGQASVFGGATGSIAEYALAKATSSAQRPKNTSFLESASLPLTGCSAVQALEDHIHLSQGQKILIHGGTGGIGSIAIQIAKHLGAYVITTVGTDNIEAAKALGADEVIDYKTQHFEEVVSGIDAVFNATGMAESSNKSFQVLKRGGILVSMNQDFDEELAKKYNVTAIAQNSQATTERLIKLAKYVEEGIVKPQVDRVFGLSETAKAYEYLETGHPAGKVVISLSSEKK
jgi:NADPH:quinone reductase-like Zn-dependent oxidoreductase